MFKIFYFLPDNLFSNGIEYFDMKKILKLTIIQYG